MNEEMSEMKEQPVWKSIIYIVGGAIAIKYGGDWVVELCLYHCYKFWYQCNACRAYHLFRWNIFTGTCDIHCGSQKERIGYGSWQCRWIECLQYSDGAGCCGNHQPDHFPYGERDRHYRAFSILTDHMGILHNQKGNRQKGRHHHAGSVCYLSCLYLPEIKYYLTIKIAACGRLFCFLSL